MNELKYKYGLDRSRPSASGARRARLIVLFILVLAATGGIIYCLVPHGEKSGDHNSDAPGAAAVKPVAGESVRADTGEKSSAANSPVKANGSDVEKVVPDSADDPAGNTDADAAPANDDPALGSSGTAGDGNVEKQDSAAIPADDRKANTSAVPEVTADPQKGKPWVADPPSEQPPAPTPPAPAPEDVRLAPLYSGSTGDLGTVVVVRPGESLSRIALRHHTTVEALRHFNHLKKDNIRIGQKLHVLPGPWRITIDKAHRELLLERSQNGSWQTFAKFSVGLGRLNSTPTAEFVISTRLRHPDWYTTDGRIIRYGDPDNQLGDYFLKLAKSGTPDKPLIGYGIHGTSDESTVGKNWSHGCVRMRNRDVGLLYYLTPSGTPVRIVPGAAAEKKLEK